MAAIRDFYTVQPPGAAAAVSGFLSGELADAANAHTIKLYSVAIAQFGGEPHGSNFDLSTFALPGQTGVNLPSECACVLTLETGGRADAPVETADGPDAGFAVDRPKQRHTGRIYVGPLNSNTVTGGLIAARPTPGFQETLRLAAKQLATAAEAIIVDTPFLAVWSRKDRAFRSVEFVSTDDAFDTQRRRGVLPTSRTRLSL
jgi:hypothetical protein